MALEYDETDFVDREFQASKQSAPYAAATPQEGGHGEPRRPYSRAELDTKVTEAQQRLTELKQAQQQLEQERTQLEEARRRRVEFQTGREEMLENLTRGVELLAEAEFNSRRQAEQMSKTLAELRDALSKIEGIQEETWTQENWNQQLTRALTTIDNARMEWNSARLKWPLLDGDPSEQGPAGTPLSPKKMSDAIAKLSFVELLRIGLAVSLPIAVALLLMAVGIILFLLFNM